MKCKCFMQILFIDNKEMRHQWICKCSMLCNDLLPQKSFACIIECVLASFISLTLSLCTGVNLTPFVLFSCLWKVLCFVLSVSSISVISILKLVVDQSCCCLECSGHPGAIYYMCMYVGFFSSTWVNGTLLCSCLLFCMCSYAWGVAIREII